MSIRPVIGVTPSPQNHVTPLGTLKTYGNTDGYFDGVDLTGGIPLMIPIIDGATDEIMNVLDGLILTGGGDINPARYGDPEYHDKNWGISDKRDRLELSLFKEALRHDMPVLGICRGVQVINVALGGTLYQDVPDQFDSDLQHQQHLDGVRKEGIGHIVKVEPGSQLAKIFGVGELGVNSFHHQSIKRVGDGLRVSATSADGLIEAIEYSAHPWLIGVQWHPEMMFQDHEEQLNIFRGLVEASIAYRAVSIR